jgi:hypothetical protein
VTTLTQSALAHTLTQTATAHTIEVTTLTLPGEGAGAVDVVSNVAQDRILGRTASGSGNSQELTATQVRTFLNVEDGADVTDAANVAAAGGVRSPDVVLIDVVTQAAYNALSPPVSTTLYVIVG